MDQLIKDKVQEVLSSTQNTRGETKAARDVAALIMLSIASIISVAVPKVVSNAMKKVSNTIKENTDDTLYYHLINK